ncbi:MAG: septum site-determining protein MinC [Gammaproteobacteria bacterium]
MSSIRSNSFELKGEMSMMSVLRLHDSDAGKLAAGLAAKIRQAPEFFRNVPVIIELQDLKQDQTLDCGPLVDVLREHGLVPVGVRNATEDQQRAAQSAGLALLNATDNKKQAPASTDKKKEAQQRSVIVDRPVRSGQQVYAPGADLIVAASTSAGAELLSDGCIHVYGALRGRALAGLNGNAGARIFCQNLEAELLAIAGHYRLLEDLDPEFKGRPAQVYLDDDNLMIADL